MPKKIASGKRKAAIARAVITEGKGEITINNENPDNYQEFDRLRLKEPIAIAEKILGKKDFNIRVTVRGGGEKGQIEAARLAIARAIIKYTGSKKIEKAYSDYDRNLLVADVRRKEAYKPGDSKARAKRQSSKR